MLITQEMDRHFVAEVQLRLEQLAADRKANQSPLACALELAEEIYYSGFAMVMVSQFGGKREALTRRHLKLYRDRKGLYVRTGYETKHKRYLREMGGVRFVDSKLVVFHEYC